MAYIARDITSSIEESHAPIQILVGPRQCGKSTLLNHMGGETFTEVSFDDLSLRNLANSDPALFLEQHACPLILDEIQYVPELFPELKRTVDAAKSKRLQDGSPLQVMFRLTGSNQMLLDENVKENLAGRVSYYELNTLSVHEILQGRGGTTVGDILFRGGWPELYVDESLSVVQYLNDFVRSYIEKNVVLTAGVQKQDSFNKMLGQLAARTGTLMDYANLSKDSGVRSVTIKDWVSVLERTDLVKHLKPFATNLNKRLTRTPKLYFLDTGLAARLQGWHEQQPLINSPQAGPLFETLVFSEILKFIRNKRKDWQFYFWRTRDGEEIDFIIQTASGTVFAFDAKLSMQSTSAVSLPPNFRGTFPDVKTLILITYGGSRLQLSRTCEALPLAELYDYLCTLPE